LKPDVSVLCLVWVRPIQIIVTRLLHVTMTTLHEHLVRILLVKYK
jgi:hypothetical protein